MKKLLMTLALSVCATACKRPVKKPAYVKASDSEAYNLGSATHRWRCDDPIVLEAKRSKRYKQIFCSDRYGNLVILK